MEVHNKLRTTIQDMLCPEEGVCSLTFFSFANDRNHVRPGKQIWLEGLVCQIMGKMFKEFILQVAVLRRRVFAIELLEIMFECVSNIFWAYCIINSVYRWTTRLGDTPPAPSEPTTIPCH